MDNTKVIEAVKALRLALGDTQHRFANRMKTAIRTIARWETIRPPSGGTLIQLAKVAGTAGRVDLVEVFLAAISEEIGYFVPRFEILPDEHQDFDALVAILRSSGYQKQREEWQRISRPIKERHVNSDARAATLFGLSNEVRRRLSAGESDDEIVHGLPAWQPDMVRTFAANQRELDRLGEHTSRKGKK
jgi:transcriptional regulator with XRE-family HTH domain